MTKSPMAMSEKSDSVMDAIRAALVSRGTTLRAWSRQWALANGRDPDATYATARRTIERRLEAGLPPNGRVGRAIVSGLQSELGSGVIPESAAPLVSPRPPCSTAGGHHETAR